MKTPRWLRWPLFLLLFAGTCVGLLQPAARIADPMTNAPLSIDWPGHYPILVMHGDVPELLRLDHPSHIPPLPSGATYLVRDAKAAERYLRTHSDPHLDGGWVLRVKQLADDRQRIDLYWMADGYRGSVYEATATSITPKYWKITGPGFAIICAELATAMTLVIFAVGWMIAKSCTRERDSR